MSINVPWLEVLKACYPNAQVLNHCHMMTIITICDIIPFFCEQMSEDTEVLVVSPQYNADIAVIMVITNISNVKRVFFSFIFHFRAQRTVGL